MQAKNSSETFLLKKKTHLKLNLKQGLETTKNLNLTIFWNISESETINRYDFDLNLIQNPEFDPESETKSCLVQTAASNPEPDTDPEPDPEFEPSSVPEPKTESDTNPKYEPESCSVRVCTKT